MTRVADREKSYAMPPSRPPVSRDRAGFVQGLARRARGLRGDRARPPRVWPDAEISRLPDGRRRRRHARRRALARRRNDDGRTSPARADSSARPRTASSATPEGPTAIVEAAQIVGITDADGMATEVAARSTRGMGEMIAALLDAGVRRFMIGLGGSSTNDGGAGMLDGARPSRRRRRRAATSRRRRRDLASLTRVDASGLDPRLSESAITIMSDVNNPLCGERGATAIFGPQKGVPSGGHRDRSTRRSPVTRTWPSARWARAPPTKPGAGAAGGLGFALQLVGGSFRSGAEVVADLIGLDGALRGADWALHR